MNVGGESGPFGTGGSGSMAVSVFVALHENMQRSRTINAALRKEAAGRLAPATRGRLRCGFHLCRSKWKKGRSAWAVGVGLGVLGLWVLGSAGCSRYLDPRVPEPIRPFRDPQFNRPYELYRPSGYDRRQAWPLIVVCHGSFPDSPNRQIRAWTELAESRGFLVVAPSLRSVRLGRWSSREKRKALLQADRDQILAVVRHIRAGHHISADRIFLYGWGRGAPAALLTGLEHPALFRAVAVARPVFREDLFSGFEPKADPHQPIAVAFAADDVLHGKPAEQCVNWLRSLHADVREDRWGSLRRTACGRFVDFFEQVLRKEPWAVLQVMPSPAGKPLERHFSVRTSETPLRYHWSFGDGEESLMSDPIHAYAKPGTYRVTVTLEGRGGRHIRRSRSVLVP